jgi:hypothetical protein
VRECTWALLLTYDRERDDVGDFRNHSDDPNTWMEDEVTLVARRDVKAGEELTADYAMRKDEEHSIVPWDCNCGSSLCRGGSPAETGGWPNYRGATRGTSSHSFVSGRKLKV